MIYTPIDLQKIDKLIDSLGGQILEEIAKQKKSPNSLPVEYLAILDAIEDWQKKKSN